MVRERWRQVTRAEEENYLQITFETLNDLFGPSVESNVRSFWNGLVLKCKEFYQVRRNFIYLILSCLFNFLLHLFILFVWFYSLYFVYSLFFIYSV
jgi:hypothetical protein